jgi:multisubunit Na+/H+ antiporter MnhC subunit
VGPRPLPTLAQRPWRTRGSGELPAGNHEGRVKVHFGTGAEGIDRAALPARVVSHTPEEMTTALACSRHAELPASAAGGSLKQGTLLRSPIPRFFVLTTVLAMFLSLAVALSLVVRHSPGEESLESSAPGSEATVVDASAGVRVRETPGADGATLGALKTGAQVRIVDGPESVEGEQWVKVSWQGGRLEGWFPLRYLQRIGPLDWNPGLAA